MSDVALVELWAAIEHGRSIKDRPVPEHLSPNSEEELQKVKRSCK